MAENTPTPEAPAQAERKPFDLSKLTLGEVAKLEDLSGLPLARIADEDSPQGKLLAAYVFVHERRNGHAISWPECLNLTTDEATELLGFDQDVTFTGPDGEGAGDGEPDPAAPGE